MVRRLEALLSLTHLGSILCPTEHCAAMSNKAHNLSTYVDLYTAVHTYIIDAIIYLKLDNVQVTVTECKRFSTLVGSTLELDRKIMKVLPLIFYFLYRIITPQ